MQNTFYEENLIIKQNMLFILFKIILLYFKYCKKFFFNHSISNNRKARSKLLHCYCHNMYVVSNCCAK